MNCREALALIENTSETYTVNTLRCKDISDEMESFQVNVVFVGGFSAGKTALLNALMARDVLKEGQRPETAIASELVYDTEEYVEAFSNGEAVRLRTDEALELNADSYDYLRWHLHNDALAGLWGYTLVDMPGFNSGIQAHNKAILRYVEKASAYLLVIDAENGAIHQSLADFMQEIRSYEHNLAIVVTKCDLKTPEEAKEISDSIALSAELMFGERMEVISTSREDADCRTKLETLIRRFDRDMLFRQRFVPQIVGVGESLIGMLELKKKGEKLNVAELEEEIAKRERARKQLERSLQQKRRELEEQYGSQAVASVLNEVEEALNREASSLAASVRSGQRAFDARVNAILRPVLVNAVKNYTSQSYEELVSLIPKENDTSPEPQLPSCETIEKRLNTFRMIAGKMPEEKLDKSRMIASERPEEMLNKYRLITGVLAAATNVVGPVLEVLIILAPDILRFLSGMNAGNQQEEQEKRIRNEIIPQIVSALEPEIERSLRELEAQILEDFEENAREQMEEEIRVLESLKARLQEQKDEHSRKQGEIDADILILREALNSL